MDFDRIPAIAKYLSLVFLISYLGRNTVWYFLPIYFENQIASVFLIGVITSLPAAIPLLLDIPVGNLVQRAGSKIVIFLGLLSAVIPGVLYITAIPALLVLAKIAEGLTKVLVWNGGWSIVMQKPDKDVESESISVFLLGVNLAAIVGPIIGGYLIAAQGFPVTFGLWVFTAALGVLVYYSYIGIGLQGNFKKSFDEVLHKRTYIDDWHHIRDNWANIRFPLVLVFLDAVIFSFYWLAIPLLLQEIGTDFITMGMIFGIAAVPRAFQFFFGDIADRVGIMPTLAGLTLLLTPGLVAMNFFENTIVIGGLFLATRLLSGGMAPAMHAFFDERTPDEVESELTGFLELFKHAGQTLGPIMAGTIASIWSVNTSFLGAAVIAGVIFVLTSISWLKS